VINFACPSGLVDRLSWTPGPDGVVIQAWHSMLPEAVATVVISPKELEMLLRLCSQSKGYTTWNQRPGSSLTLPSPGKKGGDK